MKRLIEAAIIALLIYISIVAWFTPTAVAACYVARGYFAVGGEWFALLTVPFALVGICKLYMGAITDRRIERRKNYGTGKAA